MNTWKIRDGYMDLTGLPVVMGILNMTPDSFSDGGDHNDLSSALKWTEKMVSEGAGIIDVGGESTRPGSVEITAEEEIERVAPVIERIASEFDVKISVDTYRAATAEAALKAGAHIINDVWGFRREPEIAKITKRYEAGAVLMSNAFGSEYDDIISFKNDCYEKSLKLAHDAGITDDQILLDPGVGFGTSREDDISLMRELDKYDNILLGVSRKRIVDYLIGGNTKPKERTAGSVGLALAGAAKGVKVLRVHDVKETLDALKAFSKVMREDI